MPKNGLILTADVATLLGVHVRTVHRLVESGRLKPTLKVPGPKGAYLFDLVDVEKAKAARETADVA